MNFKRIFALASLFALVVSMASTINAAPITVTTENRVVPPFPSPSPAFISPFVPVGDIIIRETEQGILGDGTELWLMVVSDYVLYGNLTEQHFLPRFIADVHGYGGIVIRNIRQEGEDAEFFVLELSWDETYVVGDQPGEIHLTGAVVAGPALLFSGTQFYLVFSGCAVE